MPQAEAPPARVPPPPPAIAPEDLTDLEAQARYHRDRLALYRARMQGSHPTSTGRLAELERAAAAADERLSSARRRARS